MKALVWHGTADVRCDTVPDPRIEEDRDAIIKVTSCAICGSDLHLFDHFMPGMKKGDVLGHEFMGEVVEVGPGAKSGWAIASSCPSRSPVAGAGRAGTATSRSAKVPTRTRMAEKLLGHATRVCTATRT